MPFAPPLRSRGAIAERHRWTHARHPRTQARNRQRVLPDGHTDHAAVQHAPPSATPPPLIHLSESARPSPHARAPAALHLRAHVLLRPARGESTEATTIPGPPASPG